MIKKIFCLILIISTLFCGQIANLRSGVSLVSFAETPPDFAKEEEEILNQLFDISSKIELTLSKIPLLESQIENTQEEISIKKESLVELEEEFEEKKLLAGKVLRVIQRTQGLGYIFTAKDFGDFLNRISYIQKINQKSKDVLFELRTSQDTLEKVIVELSSVEQRLTEEKENLIQLHSDLEQSKAQLEAELQSLREERAGYEAKLRLLSDNFSLLKTMFAGTVEKMRTRIETGDLPSDTVSVKISIFGSQATLSQEKMNELDPELAFQFEDGYVIVAYPSHEVRLKGEFRLINPQKIGFFVESGTFRGLEFSDDALEDLFLLEKMEWDLKALIGKNQITSLKMKKGIIEMSVKIVL